MLNKAFEPKYPPLTLWSEIRIKNSLVTGQLLSPFPENLRHTFKHSVSQSPLLGLIWETFDAISHQSVELLLLLLLREGEAVKEYEDMCVTEL